METNIVELKELIWLNEQLFAVTNTVSVFRDNVKGLKIIKELVDVECDSLKKSKAPVSFDNLQGVLWRYEDLKKIIKGLCAGNNTAVVGKASSDLNEFKEKISKVLTELKNKLGESEPENKGDTASEKLSSFMSGVGKKLSELGNAVMENVNETVDELKKSIAGDESSK